MRASSFLLALSLVLAAACTDPVNDAAIEALGPETSAMDENHRPGQPCVLCHREDGPASSSPFSVAGTVYETRGSDAGAARVDVHLVSGGGSEFWAVTNGAGNFYVRKTQWDPVFPLARIEIGRVVDGGSKKMRTFVGREPSCAGCHFKPNASSISDAGPRDYEPLRAVEPIYLKESP